MANFYFIGDSSRPRCCQARKCNSDADYDLSRGGRTNFCYSHALKILHDDIDDSQSRLARVSNPDGGHLGGGWAAGMAMGSAQSDIDTARSLLRRIPQDYSRRAKEKQEQLRLTKKDLEVTCDMLKEKLRALK